LSFQKSDLPLSKGSNALGLSRVVFRNASGLEEGISNCAGIHLVGLNISEPLALVQRSATCTVFFKKMRVFQA
jgi:hypothetical protein